MPGQKASEETRREQILTAAYEVASRKGIDGLTVRAVAAKAKLSHGLILFHFKRRNQLVAALLDRVLATTLVLTVPDDIAHHAHPMDRLRALLRLETDRLATDPRRIRLFFEYWALGFRHRAIRVKISAALERYRDGFHAIVRPVLEKEPARFGGVTADGLAGVAVSVVTGGAVQAMIDPDDFDIQEYLSAVHGMIGRLTALAA